MIAEDDYAFAAQLKPAPATPVRDVSWPAADVTGPPTGFVRPSPERIGRGGLCDGVRTASSE
jgi:hypothetical protein